MLKWSSYCSPIGLRTPKQGNEIGQGVEKEGVEKEGVEKVTPSTVTSARATARPW